MGSTKKTKSSDTLVRSTTECSILTTITTTATYRSSSTSALMATVRPQTLNVNNPREAPTIEANFFIGEALYAWRAKARCSVVPAERVQELFHELHFNPSERQISDMLQTAKMFARKGSRQWHGLTFGEFCVLAADLKRFRTSIFPPINEKKLYLNSRNDENDTDSNPETSYTQSTSAKRSQRSRHKSTKPVKSPEDRTRRSSTKNSIPNLMAPKDSGTPVEVFLGGSCNPTTWRKDVAIPALEKNGISFYNPQVSDWTPDLIELEHRAKEKARVLFFVMDSETRASAGAIEAAHIAGQNCKQLVLVLHPYKREQYILNEPLSHQEYIDLTRNQQILRELVTRRGLPVLDNIPAGLQRTKEILAGIRDPPSNIASILIVVRGAFDRVNVTDTISLEQCQRALSFLGYAQSLLTIENLKSVITSQRESLELSPNVMSAPLPEVAPRTTRSSTSASEEKAADATLNDIQIDFDQFCILAAYLSVLQQEIHESGCISPIKGTNVPPPPVYLTNLQGFQTRPGDENITINYYTKHIFRTNSSTSVPGDERPSDVVSRNRDSGTSSPQPVESVPGIAKSKSSHVGSKRAGYLDPKKAFLDMLMFNTNTETNTTGEESDSNDSVFSSSDSSVNSLHCSGDSAFSSFEIRDVYLGGSCYLRTKWRQDYAMPYLKSKNISYHLPALHESIQPSQLDLPDKSFEDSNSQGRKQEGKPTTGHSLYRIERAKIHSQLNEPSTHEESTNWSIVHLRPNLYNPSLMDSSRVLLFVITNETRSLAPMTLAAHCIGLMYNVVLCVQMLPENCIIGNEKLTPAAIKDYNRGRSYLIDLAKRQGVPVFNDLRSALECTAEKIKAFQFQKNSQKSNSSDEKKTNHPHV